MSEHSDQSNDRPARKRVWLHIGTHKTGTTSIQRLAAGAEAQLLAHGVLYPKAGRPLVRSVSCGHHLLPWSLDGHVTGPPFWPEGVEDVSSVWRDLRAEIDISPASTVLISSEEFDTLKAEHVAALARHLDAYDVHVLCFLRRVDVFVQAMYTTDILQSSTASDPIVYIGQMRTPADYKALLAPWRKAFRRTSLHVYPYRADFDRSWGAVEALFACIGVDPASLQAEQNGADEPIENVSAPWHVVQSIRALRNMDLPPSVVADFTKAQLGMQKRARAEHDLLAPSVRRGLAHASYAQLAGVLSAPLLEDEARFFRAEELTDHDEQWLAAHKQGAALSEAFWRMRAFVDEKTKTADTAPLEDTMFRRRDRAVTDFLPKHFRKDLPPAPYFWNLDSINITDRVALVGWALPFAGKPENVSVIINGVEAPELKLAPEPILGRDYPWWPNASLSRFSVSMSFDALGERWRDHKELRVEVRPREEEGVAASYDDACVMYYQQADDLAHAPAPDLLQTIGCATLQQFLLGGRTLYHRFQGALLAETGRSFANAGRVLDWGCGPGRVALHVRRDIQEAGNFTGIDIVEESVAYANAALGPHFRACETTPPLPVDAASIDVLYAYSVLTHIPGPMLRDWLAELARVMKPGAVALVTTLGELAFARFRPYASAAAYEAWRNKGVSDEALNSDLANTKVPQDYYRNTLISTPHFMKLCEGLFDVRRKVSNFYFYQDLFVLRRL